ncbi:inositol monophosphatase family protein [Streptococcus sp. sy018]|uniref:inositol monophosphatase family protein n=1 Tax=Streptococcus sp. sy018 TaxID=2600147 RepID=UPI0011B74DED|nr:inositol monophosphatase family protein [Streptococcus sp. sy018]TWS95673.1 inositol monophosphatase family protein [Streptococcus sp. sy018]
MENKYSFACQLIRQAGQLLRQRLSEELIVEEKSGFADLVTNLDLAIQDFLVEQIKTHYPTDAILAEEKNLYHDLMTGTVWILDPIDGTTNFIVQKDDFCILLAHYHKGQAQFGLIYQVMADKLYHGGGEFEVYCNEDKLLPYQDKPLTRSLFACNSQMYRDNVAHLTDFLNQTLGVRMYGGAGISLSYVLSGRLSGYISNIQVWDYLPAKIMGEKLGYCLLTLSGQEPDFKTRQEVMFIPKVKQEEILAYLSGIR